MDVNIKNIESLPEEERERFQAFLKAALAEDAEDQEFRAYLINFLDTGDDPNGYALDAAEIWEAASTHDRYQHFEYSPIAMDDDLASFIDAFGEDDNDLEPPLPEGGESSAWGDVEAEDNEAPEADFGIPESDLEVPPAFGDEATGPESVVPDADTAGEAPENGPEEVDPALEQDEPESEADAEIERRARERADELMAERAERDAEVESAVQHRLSMMGAGDGGPPQGAGAESTSSSALRGGARVLSDGLQSAAGGSLKLIGETLKFVGYAGAGVGSQLAREDVRNALFNKARFGATAVRKASAPLIAKSMDFFRGKRRPLSGSDRAALTGKPMSADIVDIRQGLKQAVQAQTKTSVQRDLAVMADKQLSTKHHAMLATMGGIDEGTPNQDGLYSQMEVAEGVTLGSALHSAQAGGEEGDMARSLIERSDALPSATDEMAFVTEEYQRLGDQLEDLSRLAEEQDWTQEDIGEKFVKPVEEWMDRREGQDAVLNQLAELQSDTAENTMSPEELAQQKERMERLVETVRNLVDRLMGRGQSQGQDQPSAPGPTRSMG